MAENLNPQPANKAVKSLRKEIQRKRVKLTQQQQITAARLLANNARRYAPLMQAKRIASYQAFQGEISPELLIKQLNYQSLLLPKIDSFFDCSMHFYDAQQTKLKNRYGIWEPAGVGAPTDLRHVDVVLLPLVAFDRSGNRVGMGAGFYDRALSFRLSQTRIKRPLLVGLAHALQEVTELSRQFWDVPLDVIITDQELIKPSLK